MPSQSCFICSQHCISSAVSRVSGDMHAITAGPMKDAKSARTMSEASRTGKSYHRNHDCSKSCARPEVDFPNRIRRNIHNSGIASNYCIVYYAQQSFRGHARCIPIFTMSKMPRNASRFLMRQTLQIVGRLLRWLSASYFSPNKLAIPTESIAQRRSKN